MSLTFYIYPSIPTGLNPSVYELCYILLGLMYIVWLIKYYFTFRQVYLLYDALKYNDIVRFDTLQHANISRDELIHIINKQKKSLIKLSVSQYTVQTHVIHDTIKIQHMNAVFNIQSKGHSHKSDIALYINTSHQYIDSLTQSSTSINTSQYRYKINSSHQHVTDNDQITVSLTAAQLASLHNTNTTTHYPLIVALCSNRSDTIELTLMTYKTNNPASPSSPTSNILKLETQLLLYNNKCYDMSELYGIDDDSDDCIICLTDQRNIILLPCRHLLVCHTCYKGIKTGKCPSCRAQITSYAKFKHNVNDSKQ